MVKRYQKSFQYPNNVEDLPIM